MVIAPFIQEYVAAHQFVSFSHHSSFPKSICPAELNLIVHNAKLFSYSRTD